MGGGEKKVDHSQGRCIPRGKRSSEQDADAMIQHQPPIVCTMKAKNYCVRTNNAYSYNYVSACACIRAFSSQFLYDYPQVCAPDILTVQVCRDLFFIPDLW